MRLFNGKSVAFVGMAPNIQGKGLGSEIDSHDIVYRSNVFPIAARHQRDYGTRCDVISVISQHFHLLDKLKVPNLVHFHPITNKKTGINYYYVSPEKRAAMSQSMLAVTGRDPKTPTAGIIAMFLALAGGCKSFKFYGITGYQNSSGEVVNHTEKKHYIDWLEKAVNTRQKNLTSDMKNYKYHNFAVQNLYLSTLYKRGIISFDAYSEPYFNEQKVKRNAGPRTDRQTGKSEPEKGNVCRSVSAGESADKRHKLSAFF